MLNGHGKDKNGDFVSDGYYTINIEVVKIL